MILALSGATVTRYLAGGKVSNCAQKGCPRHGICPNQIVSPNPIASFPDRSTGRLNTVGFFLRRFEPMVVGLGPTGAND